MAEKRKFEFVYAEIVGVWSYSDETFVAPHRNNEEHVEPGQFGLKIKWGCRDYGFGEYAVRFYSDGSIQVEDEMSGPEFSAALFEYLGLMVAKTGEHEKERDERQKREGNDE